MKKPEKKVKLELDNLDIPTIINYFKSFNRYYTSKQLTAIEPERLREARKMLSTIQILLFPDKLEKIDGTYVLTVSKNNFDFYRSIEHYKD